MIGATRRTDYLLIAGFWLVLIAAFWAVQVEWPWTVLLPLMGLLWMGVPLAMTRVSPRPLIVVSAIVLAALLVFYLMAVWATAMILGFFGSLIFEVEQATSGGMAGSLVIEGIKVAIGAVAGVGAGLAVRLRFEPLTNEPGKVAP